jgi:hypothetical protein
MNTELEDRLRTDMERFTRDIYLSPGLAQRARRHSRKRRRTLRAAAAAALAAGAAAGAGVSGAFGSAPAPPAHTTAYVLQHVDGALAPASVGTLIGFSRTWYTSGTTVEPVAHGVLFGSSLGPAWGVASMLRWEYRGTMKLSAYGPDGLHVFDLGFSTAKGSVTQTAVIYHDSTWWTVRWTASAVSPVALPRRVVPPNLSFGYEAAAGDLLAGEWAAMIRQGLSLGVFELAGHQVVDGIDAIKLTGAHLTVAKGIEEAGVTLWVDPATYLPVRLDEPGLQTDFRWLHPTQANLALLKESIPAGFQQVLPAQEPSRIPIVVVFPDPFM